MNDDGTWFCGLDRRSSALLASNRINDDVHASIGEVVFFCRIKDKFYSSLFSSLAA